MANYCRLRVAGATYVFTVALEHRGGALLVERAAYLRNAWLDTIREMPLCFDAFVVLPDHLHTVWTLP